MSQIAVKGPVAMLTVGDVQRSLDWYQSIGFYL
jgi:hypothetical protein